MLEPLIRPPSSLPGVPETDFVELEETDSPKIKALLALREIEFDRATGKLSDEDYEELKTKYGRMALQAIDDAEHDAVQPDDLSESGDVAEIAVARARSRKSAECVQCGTRPESGAIFCSDCGRSLLKGDAAPRCWACGSDLPSNAHFCAECGFSLSA